MWSQDLVKDRTHDGRKYHKLNIGDEFTRECLAIHVARRLRSMNVIELLAELFLVRAVPGYFRSDNDPEFVAKAVQGWLAAVGVQTAYIIPGSPWENGYIESFNARLRDELLDGRSSSASKSPESSSKVGGAISTRCVVTDCSDTRHPRPRSWCSDWPLGRHSLPVTCVEVESLAPPA